MESFNNTPAVLLSKSNCFTIWFISAIIMLASLLVRFRLEMVWCNSSAISESFNNLPKVPLPWVKDLVTFSRSSVNNAAFSLVWLRVFSISWVATRLKDCNSSPGPICVAFPSPGTILISILPTSPSEPIVATASFLM